MTKSDLINAVMQLGLKPNEYVVIGSGVLCALGIREANDIDLVVDENTFRECAESGQWTKKQLDGGVQYLEKDEYEVYLSWDRPDSRPNLADLKADQILVEGTPFVSLERLKKWKQNKGRQKDLIDIELISDFQKANSNQ